MGVVCRQVDAAPVTVWGVSNPPDLHRLHIEELMMQSETQSSTYRAMNRRDSTGGCVEITTSTVVKFYGGARTDSEITLLRLSGRVVPNHLLPVL